MKITFCLRFYHVLYLQYVFWGWSEIEHPLDGQRQYSKIKGLYCLAPLVAPNVAADFCGTSCLKKNEIKPWQRKGWVIPPEQDGSFVANMKMVLDIYKRPFDPLYPVV